MLKKICCCCCILVVILGALSGTGWFVIRQFSPLKSVIYNVTDASLTRFNLTAANNTIQYNLSLNMTVENRNKWNDFHYENFEAVASYKNQDLSNSSLAPFLVGHKNSFVLTPSFEGRRLVALSNDEVSNFRNSTVFDIVLKLNFKYWTKIGAVKIDKELQMACYFKVPLSSGGKSAENFDSTKCDKA
ncbi:unnamed protein product [Prunus armeniaca]|uniref:Late embryogenesis abundant protein LEA-2 subgroup domain-containing protein n=1 Tax=Prunus armeniaca TaxID=36596 RepID=A0A6J5VFY4_PRUAR|nr:unnamed protein product [Prunus armeniaca]